jgi:hypothetical protein
VYEALAQAQSVVEESISDVRDMIRDRLGEPASGPRNESSDETVVQRWEVEWVEEVQKLLEMDHGWGWTGFWVCVRDNLHVSSHTSSWK